jgi:hypothetical protein
MNRDRTHRSAQRVAARSVSWSLNRLLDDRKMASE